MSSAKEAGPEEAKDAEQEDACFDAMSSAAAPADLAPTEFPLNGGLTVGEIAFGGETGDDRILPMGNGAALHRVSTT